MKHIGKHLREIRNNWGKTLKEVSEKCGVSIDYLSKVEKGDRVPTEKLLKDISKFYSIPYQELNELRVSDEIMRLFSEVEDRMKMLKLVRKRLKNPDHHIHISNSNPLKKEKSKRKYMKGSKRGKVKGLNFYIQSNGKLKKREREQLLKVSEDYMSLTVVKVLDSSLSDIELIDEWNQFFDQHGMRFPEFEEQWFKENPIPEEMNDREDDSNSDKKKKIELPKFLKKKDSLRSDLG
ncbi:helix-turn-helix domain-containing protein [Gracilimonas sp. Q87]|uniref:helix-turn-helix domain-containing protein n=1 Tax=Gracilimonas sp. Q87 TaxID=3384766 RepID=UPI003983F274